MNEYEYKKKKWDELVKGNDTTMDELELQEIYYNDLRDDYQKEVLKDKPFLLEYGDLAKSIMKDLPEIKFNPPEKLPTNIKNIVEQRLQWLNNPPDSAFYDANNRLDKAIEKFKRNRNSFILYEKLFNNEAVINDVWVKLNKISIISTNEFLTKLFILPEIYYINSKDNILINDTEIHNYEKINNKLNLLEKVLNEAEENKSLLFRSYTKDYNKLLKAIKEFRLSLSEPLKMLSYNPNSRTSNRGSKEGNGQAIFFARRLSFLLRNLYKKPLNKINSLIIDNIFDIYYSENEITKFYKQIHKSLKNKK